MDELLNEIREVKRLLLEQTLLKKEVLNFSEAAQYLDISESHLYKLTSRKQVPHYCPQGKRLYFNRAELDRWLLQNRQITDMEIEQQASDYIIQNRRK